MSEKADEKAFKAIKTITLLTAHLQLVSELMDDIEEEPHVFRNKFKYLHNNYKKALDQRLNNIISSGGEYQTQFFNLVNNLEVIVRGIRDRGLLKSEEVKDYVIKLEQDKLLTFNFESKEEKENFLKVILDNQDSFSNLFNLKDKTVSMENEEVNTIYVS